MLSYRRDIDGLRAIAVLAVLFYHAEIFVMTGGFIGVDIFFVISGYLISSIIFKGLQDETFRLADFFEKRIKRIFPPLIIILLFTLITGWTILLPNDFSLLCREIAAGAAFITNFTTWSDVDYFDRAAATKPLLHLWSLSIEEQFYLIWPITALWLWRLRRIPQFLWGLLLLSFATSVLLAQNHSAAAYYLPFGRFWELLVGSCLAYYTLDQRFSLLRFFKTEKNRQQCRDIISITGLYLLIIGFILIDPGSAFPGWWALLPTLGTVLLISAGPEAVINKHFLANRFLVFIGLISYSLYLWHWPLLVFAKVFYAGKLPFLVKILILIAAIIIAQLSTLLIERPIRLKAWGVSARFIMIMLIAMLCLLLEIGVVNHYYYKNGSATAVHGKKHLHADINDFDQYINNFIPCSGDFKGPLDLSFCYLSSHQPPTMAIFGDSHGQSVFSGIAYTDKKNSWLMIGQGSCPPTSKVNAYQPGNVEDCLEKNHQAMNILIQQKSIHTVALVSFGFYFAESGFADQHKGKHDPKYYKLEWLGPAPKAIEKAEVFFRGLEETIRQLQQGGKRVIFYLDTPEIPFMPKHCIYSPTNKNTIEPCSISAIEVQQRQRQYRTLAQRLQRRNPKLELFDPLPTLCKDGECIVGNNEMMYFRDSHHLSFRGSSLLARPFLNQLSRTADPTAVLINYQ